ncbi:MAG: tetratricopeptide repeat protein [Planctomycetota bacterium]
MWATGCGDADFTGQTDAELLTQATDELSYYNFDRAYGLFAEIRRRAEETEGDSADAENNWSRATFGMATAAQNRTPPSPRMIQEAADLYAELVERSPASEFAPRSLLNLGRLAEIQDHRQDRTDLEAARRYYSEVLETWPEAAIAGEAALRYADTFVQRYDNPASVREGLLFIASWIAEQPESPYASVIWEYLGQVHLQITQEPGLAIENYRQADAVGFIEPTVIPSLYWLIAQVSAEQLNDPETAARYYQRIITETPRSGRAFEAQLALGVLAEAHPALEIEIPAIEEFYLIDPADSSEPAP